MIEEVTKSLEFRDPTNQYRGNPEVEILNTFTRDVRRESVMDPSS